MNIKRGKIVLMNTSTIINTIISTIISTITSTITITPATKSLLDLLTVLLQKHQSTKKRRT